MGVRLTTPMGILLGNHGSAGTPRPTPETLEGDNLFFDSGDVPWKGGGRNLGLTGDGRGERVEARSAG